MKHSRLSSLAQLLVTLAAFALYVWSAAPGVTWAHQGADGGELLAAAITNGVPHPPGYPVYILLLQGWLALLSPLISQRDLAWGGALLSGFCAALSVFFTIQTAILLPTPAKQPIRWAILAGLAWALSPLLWSQAVITEVYGLHALAVSVLGWAGLSAYQKKDQARQARSQAGNARLRYQLWAFATGVMFGVAHHLTLLLLVPSVLYLFWNTLNSEREQAGTRKQPDNHSGKRSPTMIVRTWMPLLLALLIGGGIGLLFHLRTWLAAANAAPVNWGFADNWQGLWWLMSGAAYRGYLFAGGTQTTLSRIADWSYTITTQFTPLGLALALTGLAYWDQYVPRLRNFSLLWLVPISIYAISYYTRDSEIYLIPVIWLMSLCIAVGCATAATWLVERLRWSEARATTVSNGAIVFCLLLLLLWRYPQVSLRTDNQARQFLHEAGQVLQSGDIIVSRSDAQTFALWYGAWASKQLPEGLIIVNDSLYQFDWYRRLQGILHPDLAGVADSVPSLIAAQKTSHAIFFAEPSLGIVGEEEVVSAGPLWKYQPKESQ